MFPGFRGRGWGRRRCVFEGEEDGAEGDLVWRHPVLAHDLDRLREGKQRIEDQEQDTGRGSA